jgi:hypothetical protein
MFWELCRRRMMDAQLESLNLRRIYRMKTPSSTKLWELRWNEDEKLYRDNTLIIIIREKIL